MIRHYRLDDAGVPVPCLDFIAWARWYETSDRLRIVAKTRVDPTVTVSTVFLGLDHNFDWHGDPILWETLVFGGPMDGEGGRYSTREAAVLGHNKFVELARQAGERHDA